MKTGSASRALTFARGGIWPPRTSAPDHWPVTANLLSIVGPPVVLSAEERSFREAQVRRNKAARPLSDRCPMVLLSAERLRSKEVAERLGVHEHTVGKWHRRLVKDRIEGLTDEHRPGRPRTVMDAQVAEVIERTLHTTPKDATHYLECSCTPRAAAGKSSAASGKVEARHRRNGALAGAFKE